MKNPFLGSLRPCKICGRQVFSSKAAFEHPLGGICSICIRPEEKKEIEGYLLQSIMSKKRKKGLGNPIKVHPEALESLKRYKEDLKAGHKGGAEYWRGSAAAYFTANPLDNIRTLQHIANDKQADYLRFGPHKVGIDTLTAQVLLKLYENLGTGGKTKFERMANSEANFHKLVDYAWKTVK